MLTRVTFSAIVIAAGCAVVAARSVSPDETPDARYAYLYGRFHIKNVRTGARGEVIHPTLVLTITCDNGQSYTISFDRDREIQVLKVFPSRCWLARITPYDEKGVWRRVIAVDPATANAQTFDPGGAYYIGDYFAKAGIDYRDRQDRLERYRAWNMSPADGRYETTTAEMQRGFPALASWPKENKPLLRSVPRETKPGAVVVDDPDEPLMTPERIARIAALTRSSHPAPAACEAACPKGQCLPFRGPSGAAMTCIVRCNTHSDCPGGFACNCPNTQTPDGPDCHPIATTPATGGAPADKLARICLPAPGAAPPSSPAPPAAPPAPR